MTGLNQVLSVSDDLVRYLKACGKTSVLQTKPVNPTQLKGLKLAPDAIGDTVTISQKVVKNSCTDKLKLLFPQRQVIICGRDHMEILAQENTFFPVLTTVLKEWDLTM